MERADEWADDTYLQALAQYAEETATAAGQFDPDTVAEHLELADDVDAQRYAYLHGIDTALQLVHPDTDVSDRVGLDPIAVRLRRTGRLNSDPSDGALLPRFSFPDRFRQLPDDVPIEQKADLFESVIVAAPDLWAVVDPIRIPRAVSPPSSIRNDGIRVGCAPLCDGDDIALTAAPGPPRRRYSTRLRGDRPAARIAQILERLDETGAHMAVMPELTLDADMLASWRRTLAETIPPSGSQLRLLMVGTGAFAHRKNGRFANRGVLLDRAGRVLLEQDKRHPFTLSRETISEWGLEPELGADAAAEPLTPGARLRVAEGPLGRLIVLVCEDLGRTTEDGRLLFAVGPSVCLTPVFSKPTLEHYWEHSRAKGLAAEIGASVVVANSMVIADRQRAAGILPEGDGTALAHGPAGYRAAAAADPGDVVVLRLHPEDVVQLV